MSRFDSCSKGFGNRSHIQQTGKTMIFFNTAGPVNCEDHYCLPPLKRFDLEELLSLIDQKKYFVLHAPRQTGKTSCLLALMEYLNEAGKYTCLYFNVEAGQSAREDVKRGMRTVIGEIASRARIFLNDEFPLEKMKEVPDLWGEDGALKELLSQWSNHNSKPLVLFIDEIDSLVGDTLRTSPASLWIRHPAVQLSPKCHSLRRPGRERLPDSFRQGKKGDYGRECFQHQSQIAQTG